MKNIILFFSVIILLTGCNSQTKIFVDHIRSSKPLDHGFNLFQISVKEFNQEGRPTNYEVKSGVSVSPITAVSGNPYFRRYSESEKSVMKRCRSENDSILNLNNGKGIRRNGEGIGVNEYIENESILDSLIRLRFPFEAQKTLYFEEKNPNYIWSYCNDGYRTCIFDFDGGHHESLPEELKINQWYMIDLSNSSNINEKLFFKLREKSKIEQYYYFSDSKWDVFFK